MYNFDFEVAKAVVAAKLTAEGVTDFDLRRGNNNVWATYGRISEYYYVNGDQIISVVVD